MPPRNGISKAGGWGDAVMRWEGRAGVLKVTDFFFFFPPLFGFCIHLDFSFSRPQQSGSRHLLQQHRQAVPQRRLRPLHQTLGHWDRYASRTLRLAYSKPLWSKGPKSCSIFALNIILMADLFKIDFFFFQAWFWSRLSEVKDRLTTDIWSR